jgi:hypothetical protein
MSDKKTAEEAARDYVKPDSSSVDVDGIDADLIKAYLAGVAWSRENEGLAAIDEAVEVFKNVIPDAICRPETIIRTLQSIRAKYATR